MIKVNFLGPIGLDSIELESRNFMELKDELNKIDELKSWIPLCAVALNDEIINDISNIVFKDNDTISLLPPVCGG
ncbi:MoaD/ThiS family protein [Helicobacter sp. MIT 14-3879]|uniref:MoaD/ThiS family protein n=1 Tax=Helicobacter sp. MIT 14-3879 TaxID=2040649 RepID=UPI000E1EE67F|nr:MoaD/ThiS family protein [Helicobacter sp. MIT 14-3879]RDU64773.1 molybdopterin synthase sulfur carrier subunit [Helicobacter sp. MIT 14-3879]